MKRVLYAIGWLLCLTALSASAGKEMEALFLSGKAALEDGLYELSQKQFEQYLQCASAGGAPDQAAQAVSLLVRAMHAQGNPAGILEFLSENKKWLQEAKDTGLAPFWRALARYELGDAAVSLEELKGFEEAHARTEYVPNALRLRAWCWLKLGRVDEALREFALCDERFGKEAAGQVNLLEWGKALVSVERLPEAGRVLQKLSNAGGNDAVQSEGRYWLGRVMMSTQNWEGAAALLGYVAQNEEAADDLRAESWYSLAAVYGALSKATDAAGAYGRGIEQARSAELKLHGRCELGLMLLDGGDVAKGVPVLKAFVSDAPSHPRAGACQLKLAAAVLDSGDAEQAVSEYQYYLETFTNLTGQARAQRGRGWALTGLRRYAEAATAFMKASELFADPVEKEKALFKAADACFANGQYKLAAQTYERLLALFPDTALSPQAAFQLAESRARGGDTAQAEKDFLALAAEYPSTEAAEESLLRVAELREFHERWLDAVESYDRLMNGYTNGAFYSEALLGRGLIRYRLYRFQEAIRDFETIIARFPLSPAAEEAAHKMALSWYWVGQDAKALGLAREFLGQHPESPLAPRMLFWMAKYEFNHEHYEEAEKLFVDLVAKYPNDSDGENALLWAGRSAFMRDEYLRAIELLTRVIKEYPQGRKLPEARFTQGDALCRLAKFSEAILIFQELITRYPESALLPETWIRTGDCQFMLGAENPKRYEEAVQSFTVVANNHNVDPDLLLQAQYKIGRCLEKMGRVNEAVEQYYTRVMVPFLDDRDKGKWHTEAAKTWFWRASRDAADILEAQAEWRKVVSILERVVGTGVPDEPEIRERIKRIRADHWLPFS